MSHRKLTERANSTQNVGMLYSKWPIKVPQKHFRRNRDGETRDRDKDMGVGGGYK